MQPVRLILLASHLAVFFSKKNQPDQPDQLDFSPSEQADGF
jgi:hypothetical protein